PPPPAIYTLSLHDALPIYEVRRTGRIMEVPVGEELIGRVVNPLGQPVDGMGPINTTKTRPIESPAPGVMDRKSVHEPLQTGIKADRKSTRLNSSHVKISYA